MISFILAIVSGFVIFGADQFTKYLVTQNFQLGESKDFIKGFLDFTYIHNTGGAWGMLRGNTWILLSLTVVIMLICLALLLKKGLHNKLLFWGISLVMFGGLGNLFDRIFRNGNVIDFLHFSFFPSFPVFNLADCGIVIGAGILILYFIIDMVKDARKGKTKPLPEDSTENDE